MAVTLLPLANGHTSLEFSPAELPSVSATIQKLFGSPEQDRHPFTTEYRFGGSCFIFQNEWDDPCLISATVEGDEILGQVFADLTEQKNRDSSI